MIFSTSRGHENVTADCLSRLPLPSTEPSLEHDLEVVALTSMFTAITSSEFKAACDSCPIQAELCRLLASKWAKCAKALDHALKPYFQVRHELSLQDGCVVHGTHTPPGSRMSPVQVHRTRT